MTPTAPREAPPDPSDVQSLDLILERDPSGAYAVMDSATRESYRRRCQELAERSRKDPFTVAREALLLSEEREPGDARGRHVGVWLMAEGQPQLEARLGCHLSRVERARRFVRQHVGNVYLGSLLVLLVLALVGLERYLAACGIGAVPRLGLVALLTPSILDLIQSRIDLLLGRLSGPLKPLPRLDPERIFTPNTRTLVVTPLLVASTEDIESQLRMMEINSLGNVEPDLYFALLTDFRDAAVKEEPSERALLERMERGIRELNERHGDAERPRFFVLHRERRWNPVARRWMGWERKRGKLDEFNRLLLGARDTSYTSPLPEVLRSVRYVITLDADTHLVPGSAARLVATLHHPLNQARFDATGQRVVAGYSLLQPSCEFAPTRAQWLVSKGWPVSLTRNKKRPRFDLLSMHQAVFGTGEFYGKGIYDVAAFARALEGRIPENAILSHDRLEGLYARVAFIHDIKMFEGAPGNYSVLARIWHRWIRGDWQVLPWILPRVPAQGGRRVANTLSVFDRWKLLAAPLRLLLIPLAVLTLACGWLWLPGRLAGAWTLGMTMWMNRQSILDMLGHLPRLLRNSNSLLGGLRVVISTAVGIPLGTLLATVAALPVTALTLDAIIRAQYRLTFDRTHMLDWTTHAHSVRKGGGFASKLVLPEIGGAALLALGLGGVLLAFNPEALPGASPLLLGWIPFLVIAMRERAIPKTQPVPPAELDRLRVLARDAWSQYAQWHPTRDSASDEGQEVSPTDLALWLVAPMSAYHLEYLNLDEFVARLDTSLAVISGLERHRGHLLDRYDVREWRPVGPRHLTTAESGVMAAALVVVESGLRAARKAASGALLARLEDVEARARVLREEMDFTFLYDTSAQLFHVGYDVDARAADAEHQGLLTSGAMLAGFMAIARKQAPLAHWLALTASDQRLRAKGVRPSGNPALAEQLLPTLFLWFPPWTLLSQAAEATVEGDLDAAHHSLLALRFRPKPALAQLRHATHPGSSRPQAMAVAAVANLACDDILVQHFHQHWQTAWVEALVFETKDVS